MVKTARMLLNTTVVKDEEVRRRSFGPVRLATYPSPAGWEDQRETLYDPRTFGFSRSWECPCGRIKGRKSELLICDVCGVRIGSARELRRRRFGHIELAARIAHPMSNGAAIGVIPVLPIAYRCDRGEEDLNYLYSRVLAANARVRCAPDPASQDAVGDLRQSVAELYCNEWLDAPCRYRGRVVRSLAYYLVCDPGASLRMLGTHLAALGMTLSMPEKAWE